MIKAFNEKFITKESLPYCIDFVIPGFEKSYPNGIFKCPSYSNSPSKKWFLSFVDRIKNTIGKEFLPVYRMGDGEFQICVGFHYRYRKKNEKIWHYMLGKFRAVLLHYCKKILKRRITFKKSGWTNADYTSEEIKSLKTNYQKQLRFIAKNGVLSLKFSYRESSGFTQQYIVSMVEWFKRHNIKLDYQNYIPVYFIYAMLTGPFRHEIYQNRRILVITSYDETKRKAIIEGLKREGVVNIQFIPLSKGRSMYDKIDLSLIQKPIDIVLVGAGVGSSNILCQLKPLNTVAIDVGYIIECLANPERKKERTFCCPDEEKNGDYHPI